MTRSTNLSRRALLRASVPVVVAGVFAPVLITGCDAAADPANQQLQQRLRELEERHQARLGVHGLNTRTGAKVAYRADERFPMCSTFKTMAVAAILRDSDGEALAQVVRYAEADLVANSPVTEQHVSTGMRVDDLCAAAIEQSDNTAANLLLRRLGGPGGTTAFCRSIGDQTTRHDRWEPDLGTAVPGDPRDTTTPAAIGRDYGELVLGRTLDRGDRALLTGWLERNTTSRDQFHAGLPGNWRIGDKTGSGSYGTSNDIGIAWTTRGTPLELAVLTTKRPQDAEADHALIAETARLVSGALAPGE